MTAEGYALNRAFISTTEAKATWQKRRQREWKSTEWEGML